MEYKINLTAQDIGIIQDSLSHIGNIIDTKLIKEKITKQFVKQLKKMDKEQKLEGDKCGNCGHRRDWHFIGRDDKMECNIPHPKCDCKEFEEIK